MDSQCNLIEHAEYLVMLYMELIYECLRYMCLVIIVKYL